ncbi:sulfatase-like hydrolase/transferase [Nibrella saemangeumensis]|uniref:Sulfatase-like hydrolase/transferase n=1 Tax=Nibrella saemangeumensis TaxID=1084526 RepID=A0ABP8MTL6_9BACT
MQYLSKISIVLFLLLACPGSGFSQKKAKQPNVILILTDDQGWGDLRSNGNSIVHTPVLDKLAKDGARFDRFYVSPLCAPTRAALLTGRYHLRTGTYWVTNGTETMRAEEVTIAEALKNAGYATGIYGKWHNGAHYPNHPNGQGFDTFFGFCAGHLTNYFDATLEYNRQPVKTKGFITDVLTDSALAFIDKHKNKPFFCYIPYNAPHSPFQVPNKYFNQYKQLGQNDELASVYGMVENIDDNIGRVLNQLTRLGLDTNTIVIFMTDNGPQSYRYNGGMKGKKGSVDEGGVRVPLFIKYPSNIKAGTKVKALTAHIDILPTIMELCGIKTGHALPLDGMSMLPLLNGQTARFDSRSLFTHVTFSDKIEKYSGAVRKANYVLVLQKDEQRLYDLQADPGQKSDIKSAKPQIAKELSSQYDSWYAAVTSNGIKRSAIPVVAKGSPVELPAHEAFLSGALQFKEEKGYAHDWLINWNKTADTASWWELDVKDEGNYQIEVLYTCNKAAIGAALVVEANGGKATQTISRDFVGKTLPSPDRVKRIEAFEKEWARISLGKIKLSKGTVALTLKTPDLPAGAALEVKALVLSHMKHP